MSGSYEKSVKGATKVKLAPPKAKYIEHILSATRTGEAGVGEIFRTLSLRLRDSTWTIAFKALIVVHIMIREGDPEAALRYLSADYRKIMAFSTYTDVQTQGRNIRAYSGYLVERARSYGKTKQDYVGAASSRLKRLSVDKGLLRETESVQEIIGALVKCDLFSSEPENEITLTAFRLLTMDLLVLFQVMNEGTISILEHYFEMSKPDAERALTIYKRFAKQTDKVVRFLQTARAYEYSTRLEVPKIKHAPTSLASSLEDYLNDQDFETNRRQYLAQQQAKTGSSKGLASAADRAFGASTGSTTTPTGSAFPDASPTTAQHQKQPSKGPAPDLIDFFSTIEQNQQPMAQNPQQFEQQMSYNPFQQQTGFVQQPTGFPQQQQSGFPQPQQSGLQTTGFQQQPVQQQQTNPFGQFQQPQQQQMQQMQPQSTGVGFGGYTATGFSNGFASPQQFMPEQTSSLGAIPEQSQPQPLQPQQTSTNPFRASVMPQQTGSTNPFSRSVPTSPQQSSPFGQQQSFNTPPPPIPQSPPNSAGLTPQRTGTNPFAKPMSPPPSQTPGALLSQATGSTNPFRQSAFVNHTTNTGWQTQQGTMGGLEQLSTVSVFPRPGQPQQQQQQQQPTQGQQQQANGSFGGWM